MTCPKIVKNYIYYNNVYYMCIYFTEKVQRAEPYLSYFCTVIGTYFIIFYTHI